MSFLESQLDEARKKVVELNVEVERASEHLKRKQDALSYWTRRLKKLETAATSGERPTLRSVD